jgi:hypothetical protein
MNRKALGFDQIQRHRQLSQSGDIPEAAAFSTDHAFTGADIPEQLNDAGYHAPRHAENAVAVPKESQATSGFVYVSSV